MSEWIPYATSDDPSTEVSIDVDFDGEREFQRSHPYLVTLAITKFATDGDGQPTDAAASEIFELEGRLEAAGEEHDAEPVCTVSRSGTYEIYSYAADAAAADGLKAAAAGTSLRVDVRVERDAAWTTYERYILRGEELEEARDADQIAQMDEAGEDLTRRYEIIFDCEVPAESVRAAMRALQSAGFSTSEEDEEFETVVEAGRTMLLTPQNLKAARAEIEGVITPLGGTYEGWGINPDDDELDEDEDDAG
ncbi:MAG TPA: DUF695 domain-containing protein [Candidatus Baltobacteraceae bacterium]|nr:DUF695 domain-containing protein [Candidatus Baltobacteraceae bacterium]